MRGDGRPARGALVCRDAGRHGQGPDRRGERQLGGHHAWQSLTREKYFRTISGKTASLFVLACQGTGMLVGLDERQVSGLRTYGTNLGLAFQVVDDILDFTSSEEELGKPVGSDLRQGTITLPVILVRDGDMADGRFAAAVESEDVDLQVRLVQESGAIEAAYAEADALIRDAREALSVLPSGVDATSRAWIVWRATSSIACGASDAETCGECGRRTRPRRDRRRRRARRATSCRRRLRRRCHRGASSEVTRASVSRAMPTMSEICHSSPAPGMPLIKGSDRSHDSSSNASPQPPRTSGDGKRRLKLPTAPPSLRVERFIR